MTYLQPGFWDSRHKRRQKAQVSSYKYLLNTLYCTIKVMKHFFPQINLADLLSFNYIHNSLNLQWSAISFIQFAHINLPDLLLFPRFSLQVFLIRTFLLSVILISNHKPLLFYTIPLNKIYNINDRKKLSKAIVIS